MRESIVAMVGIAAMGLSACSLMRPDSATTPKVDLEGAIWRADDIDGREAHGVESTLEFSAGGHVSGRGGCNRFSGTAQISGASMVVGQLAATRMACEREVMEQEARYLAALQSTRTYRMDHTQLVLIDATGKVRVRLSRE